MTVDQDQLEELKPRSTRTIDISDFVQLSEIDPVFYDRTYWLAPARRPYALLVHDIEDRRQVGITKWDPRQYKDTYTNQVKQPIDAQAKDKHIVAEAPVQEAKVVNLMAAHEASLKAASKGGASVAPASASLTNENERATSSSNEPERP